MPKHAAAPSTTDSAPTTAPSEPLLLACRFFDTECAGYLETDDLEEILYMTNADVSREWSCGGVLGLGVGLKEILYMTNTDVSREWSCGSVLGGGGGGERDPVHDKRGRVT